MQNDAKTFAAIKKTGHTRSSIINRGTQMNELAVEIIYFLNLIPFSLLSDVPTLPISDHATANR